MKLTNLLVNAAAAVVAVALSAPAANAFVGNGSVDFANNQTKNATLAFSPTPAAPALELKEIELSSPTTLSFSSTPDAPAAESNLEKKVVIAQNTSSIVAPGTGSQSAGCLSPNESCNTSVSGASLKAIGNDTKVNTNTTAGGATIGNTTAGGANVNLEGTKIPSLTLGIVNSASTPKTEGDGTSGTEIQIRRQDGSALVVKSGRKTEATNILGIAAWGVSKDDTSPEGRKLIEFEIGNQLAAKQERQLLATVAMTSDVEQKFNLITFFLADKGEQNALRDLQKLQEAAGTAKAVDTFFNAIAAKNYVSNTNHTSGWKPSLQISH